MEEEDDDGQRFVVIEMMQSMFSTDEISFPDATDLYFFVLRIPIDPEDGSDPTTLELSCALPPGYPGIPPDFSVTCDRLQRQKNIRMMANLLEALEALDEGEIQALAAVEWLKENAPRYFAQEVAQSVSGAESREAEFRSRKPKGFMREWCSFASLYKDSYISGPNRFEVIMGLARKRGLNITGMAISGKPGGLVCEGEEGAVFHFMELMRTEFFETLNPRGRKLVTRLQERWPLDNENDRYEAAQIKQKLKGDAYRSADRATQRGEGGLVKTLGSKEKQLLERLEKQEVEDKAILKTWEEKAKRKLEGEEVEGLINAGPPSKCTTKGIYKQCGCEEPPSLEEIEKQRVFKDFSVFTGKAGFEACYQDAAKVFKEMGQMDGFDAMFAFRFS